MRELRREERIEMKDVTPSMHKKRERSIQQACMNKEIMCVAIIILSAKKALKQSQNMDS